MNTLHALIDVLISWSLIIVILTYGFALLVEKVFGIKLLKKLTAFYAQNGRKALTRIFQMIGKTIHFCLSRLWRWLWT